MNTNSLKRIIRKQPVLCYISKLIYHKYKAICTYSDRNKLHREVLNKIERASTKKKIWYMGIPIHPNLGDLVQYLCIKKFLQNSFNEYELIEIPSLGFNFNDSLVLEAIKKKSSLEDIFVMQSGYTMVGRSCHPDENVHLKIIENFTNNRIVFFPQTILYKKSCEEIETIETFKKNSNILFIARDRISYNKALEMFPNTNVELYPDIVTSLIGNIPCERSERKGILFCLRVDAEKYYEDSDLDIIIKDLKSSLKCNVDITDTEISKIENDINIKYIENYLINIINKFSKYKVIITDRYHGTIFSLIAGTPVIILKTTDHKVTSGAEWFRGIYDNYIYVSENLIDAKEHATQIMQHFNYQPLDSYFKEQYYDRLKDKIERMK